MKVCVGLVLLCVTIVVLTAASKTDEKWSERKNGALP